MTIMKVLKGYIDGKIIIDGSIYKTKDQFHKDIKDKFDFPDYYGNNLDSLWDFLTEKIKLI